VEQKPVTHRDPFTGECIPQGWGASIWECSDWSRLTDAAKNLIALHGCIVRSNTYIQRADARRGVRVFLYRTDTLHVLHKKLNELLKLNADGTPR
jgi:hypothetical protein